MSQWQCEGCGAQYRDKYGLHRHYKYCKNAEQRQIFQCKMCLKVFTTKTNLRRHQNRKTPCVEIVICEKCGKRCYGGSALGNHMRVHECTCHRCGEDHKKEDQRTIIPLTHAFASNVTSEFCVGCFYDIREKFMTLMMCLRRLKFRPPPDVRRLMLMWLTVNKTAK